MRVAIVIIAGLLLACNVALGEKKVVCYFNNWSIYRGGKGQFDVSSINPDLCTHLIYNIALPTDDADLRPSDPNADLPYGRNGYALFNQLRSQNPKLTTLIAVGGYSEGPNRFSRIAANAQLRQNFVSNAIRFVKAHNFNGLDLQWSYPRFADKQNFVLLLKQLKEGFAREGLVLSAMLMGKMSADASYDVAQVFKYLDFANIIAFDLHGLWDGVTGIHSPLYPGSWESGWNKANNIDSIVSTWLSQGADEKKLVISVATYGRSFTLNSINNKGIGASASRAGNPGPYTQVAGQLGYNEICEDMLNNKWEYNFNQEQLVPYIVRNDQWVGYDDPWSVYEKVQYIKKRNLGGAFLYTLDTDDFGGHCGTVYQLLKIVNALRYY